MIAEYIVNNIMYEAGIPFKWHSKRLSELEGSDEYIEQVNKCKNWDFKKPCSLFLNSDCGTGKTHISVCLFRKFIYETLEVLQKKAEEKNDSYFSLHSQKFPYFFKESDLFAMIYESYGSKKNIDEHEVIERLVRIPILFIDDLFSMRTNDNARRVILDIIDKRIDWADKPTIISSNWSIEKIANEIDVRIASRLASGLVLNLKNEVDFRIKK